MTFGFFVPSRQFVRGENLVGLSPFRISQTEVVSAIDKGASAASPALSLRCPRRREAVRKQPADVHLSREDGEALIERIEQNALSAEDRRVLVKVLTFYFWLLFARREAKLSLKRIKALVFGEKPKPPKPPASGGTPSGGSTSGSAGPTGTSHEGQAVAESPASETKPRPPGHGRQGAEVYRAAQIMECRHEELAVGQRCPACGRGSL